MAGSRDERVGRGWILQKCDNPEAAVAQNW